MPPCARALSWLGWRFRAWSASDLSVCQAAESDARRREAQLQQERHQLQLTRARMEADAAAAAKEANALEAERAEVKVGAAFRIVVWTPWHARQTEPSAAAAAADMSRRDGHLCIVWLRPCNHCPNFQVQVPDVCQKIL
jgi:hypothetical protein